MICAIFAFILEILFWLKYLDVKEIIFSYTKIVIEAIIIKYFSGCWQLSHMYLKISVLLQYRKTQVRALWSNCPNVHYFLVVKFFEDVFFDRVFPMQTFIIIELMCIHEYIVNNISCDGKCSTNQLLLNHLMILYGIKIGTNIILTTISDKFKEVCTKNYWGQYIWW